MSKRPPEYWKAQILRVKNAIAKLQKNVDNLSSSIHFVDANYENHVLWNERQREKQQQVDIMKSQLSEFQKLLEDMQEAARSQGYGSSVYDP
jgi:chromosome segregation ATPase